MKKIIAVMFLALVLLPSAALADTIAYKGMDIPGLRVEGYVGWSRVSGQTGQFNVTWNEQETLAAYCADLLTSGVGGRYDVQSLTNFDYDQYENLYQAAWIMENYSPTLVSVDDAYSKYVATAVQASLWTLFDDFKLTGVSGSYSERNYVFSLYHEMMSAASKVDFSTYKFKNDFEYATSGRHQDVLIATPGGAAAPEPGSMLLMGSALLGTVGYLRRRRKAKPKTA
ncbi:MAG: PEP-CTERM sorting domain-containing protein [Desulfarculaceae bacterium]|nr:PEP-CTERM sorting domain-containing protein [Desulfarculaceae bacterium]MCF8073746.1 PEP-CTERM sorting domain-containing protein [Desulfarculaceae bacterium]MCF8101987.1 PEP-CTERM sorting domain-containing protein [Desulfarculaceae bacterium]MCF8115957.1 PEP-CTERM sorting domain-containing protein [Desulfarculaceae bacterium]